MAKHTGSFLVGIKCPWCHTKQNRNPDLVNTYGELYCLDCGGMIDLYELSYGYGEYPARTKGNRTVKIQNIVKELLEKFENVCAK